MNIGFDAKRAYLNASGLGNYSRSLIKSLIQEYPEYYFSLFTPKKNAGDFDNFISQHKNCLAIEPQNFVAKKLPALWRSFEITEQLTTNHIQVYHGLSNELPVNIHKFKGKKIVTIHDLIFIRYPELYPLIDREIYNRKFRKACEQADVIVAISEQTKRDIQEFYGISANKIRVIYQSCDAQFRLSKSENELKLVNEKYQLPSDFVLSVGTIEARKDILTIVKAINLLDNVKLVVVGKKRAYYKSVMEFIVAQKMHSKVIFLEDVPTQDLPALYQLSKAFIYPSLFEGFGIPILEAISSKTPVIAAKTSSLAEAGGKDSIYFEAKNYEQLASEIKRLLASKELRESIIHNSYEYAKSFSPEGIAKEMMNLYLE